MPTHLVIVFVQSQHLGAPIAQSSGRGGGSAVLMAQVTDAKDLLLGGRK